MSQSYDVIIIGAGHNGLVAAAYLAKAGRRVLVLERNNIIGGIAATTESYPGFRFNTGSHDAGMFREEIVKDLNLYDHGIEFITSKVAAFAPFQNGKSLTIWRDPAKTVQEIARFSNKDAEIYPLFLASINKFSKWLSSIFMLTPPDIFHRNLPDLIAWANVAIRTRRLGGKDMMELLRILPMTTKELLDEWFESEEVKGLLGSHSVNGSMQGPQASGTAFMFLYHQSGDPNGGFKSSQFVKGGIGMLSLALANSAEEYGAEIRTNVGVSKILVEDYRAVGVKLEKGEQIFAQVIVSSADPRHTLFGLVGATNLEPRVMRRVRNIRFRGSTAKINLALSSMPKFKSTGTANINLTGHIIICPSLDYLERAYDDAKYGQISRAPYLDIVIPSMLDDSLAPAGQHVMSINMQYAPYDLKGADWKSHKEILGDLVIKTLSNYVSDLKDIILHQQVITPLDLEIDYGLSEGSIYHGQMGLDQLLFMRPIAGYGRYRSPIDNLFLCSAGTHPGGGVTGAPGHNAARRILKKF